MVDINNFIEFQEIIGKLKHLKRTGWVIRDVPSPETVASHSWRMAVMAMQKETELQNMNINVNHVIQMCLLHDVSEAIVGDIVPEHHQITDKKISKQEKHLLEVQAIENMSNKYSFNKLRTLFIEYEEQKTPEAIVVKNLDKLDMILQAYEYITMYSKLPRLGEFMEYNHQDITMPIFLSELEEIKARQDGKQPQENSFIDFQILMGRLKHLERSGPKMYGIKNPETVASHSFRTAVMAFYLESDLQSQNIDVNQVIKMCLLHDVSEAIVGDIVPEKWQKDIKVSKQEKHKKELEAIVSMSNKFGVNFIWQAFDDMEQRKTPEASITKDIEIFESIQQAYEYIKIYPEKSILREYIPYHKPRIKSDLVNILIDGVKQKQDAFLISKNLPTFYKEGYR